jgi:hypothetical protein
MNFDRGADAHFAAEFQLPAMQFDHCFGEWKTEACTLMLAIQRGAEPVKRFDNAGNHVRRHADAAIRDADEQLSRLSATAHADLPAGRREFDSIVNQIGERLPKTGGVSLPLQRLIQIAGRGQPDAILIREVPEFDKRLL